MGIRDDRHIVVTVSMTGGKSLGERMRAKCKPVFKCFMDLAVVVGGITGEYPHIGRLRFYANDLTRMKL